jgi:hypothetical protein
LKAGITALDYWAMTPCEVYAAIDAAVWQRERSFELVTYQAWRTAAFERAKEIPRQFKHVLEPPRTKRLAPDEAKARRAEYEKMVKALPQRLVNGE